jgi:hypothetical protein
MKVYVAILPVFSIGTITATAKTKEDAKNLLIKRYYDTEVKIWELKNKISYTKLSQMSPMTEQAIKARIKEDESDIIYQELTVGKAEIISEFSKSDRYALTIERA